LYEQHSHLPQQLGCELTPDGYLKVDAFQETTVPGIYACGDNSSRTRTIANAVATGTAAGMTAGKKFITENF
jgi:thioredoxin reductase